MIRRMLFAAIVALPLMISVQARAQDVNQQLKERPTKNDIIAQMAAVRQMPVVQRNSRVNQILSEPARKTPRTDFLFCLGSAYLGDSKAQECLGKAYENGIGIVEDLSEAYTWYAVALENRDADAGPARDRVQQRLVSSYPAPSEDDLEEMVKAQKGRIEQYQSEVKKAKVN